MANVNINYANIVNLVQKQFQVVQNNITSIINSSGYNDPVLLPIYREISNLQIFVDDEQNFMKNKHYSIANAVYIILRFGNGSANFGSSVCAVTMYAFGSENKIKPVQYLLSNFCAMWTTKKLCEDLVGFEDNTTTQIWTTPAALVNFNESGESFRNLMNCSGTLVIGQNVVRLDSLTYHYVDENEQNQTEEIQFMSFQDAFQTSLEPQPYGNTDGMAKSEANFSSYAFTVSTYLLDSQLVADCFAAKGLMNTSNSGRTSEKNPNSNFIFSFIFSNGFTNSYNGVNPIHKTFKLVSVTLNQRLGEIPSVTMSFSH